MANETLGDTPLIDETDVPEEEVKQKLHVVGMVGMVVFYLVIFLAGMLANKSVLTHKSIIWLDLWMSLE